MQKPEWWVQLPPFFKVIVTLASVGSVGFAAGAAVTRTVDDAVAMPGAIERHDSLIYQNAAAIDTLRALVPEVATLRVSLDAARSEISAVNETNRLHSCYILQIIDGRDPSGCSRWVRDPEAFRPPAGR